MFFKRRDAQGQQPERGRQPEEWETAGHTVAGLSSLSFTSQSERVKKLGSLKVDPAVEAREHAEPRVLRLRIQR